MGDDQETLTDVCETNDWALKVLPALPGEYAKAIVSVESAQLVAEGGDEEEASRRAMEALLAIGGDLIFD